MTEAGCSPNEARVFAANAQERNRSVRFQIFAGSLQFLFNELRHFLEGLLEARDLSACRAITLLSHRHDDLQKGVVGMNRGKKRQHGSKIDSASADPSSGISTR